MEQQESELKKRNRNIGLALCILMGMIAIVPWVYAPLYRKLCGALGIGVPAIAAERKPIEVLKQIAKEGIGKERAGEHVSLVNFMGVSGQLPIDIVPLTRRTWVKTGEVVSVVYRVTNLSKQDLDYKAMHMVMPQNDTSFQLIKCFCDEHRVIKAGVTENLPLVFMLTKPVDGDAGLTVNYTIFKYDGPGSASKAANQISSK